MYHSALKGPYPIPMIPRGIAPFFLATVTKRQQGQCHQFIRPSKIWIFVAKKPLGRFPTLCCDSWFGELQVVVDE